MIKIKDLKKSYGNTLALDGVDLEIKDGESYIILGNVDSGTTTLFNIISNYVISGSGEVLIDELSPQDARDLVFVCPNSNFFPKWTFRKILEFINRYNDNFDMNYALELCASFRIDLDKKNKVDENVGIYNIFYTIITICMGNKYLLFDNPEIGVSKFDILKLNELILANKKIRKYTPIIHCKTVNEFINDIDNFVVIKNKKIELCEKIETLKKKVYVISGSSRLIKDTIKDKNVLAIKGFKNYSKLISAFIMADNEEEKMQNSIEEVSLKDLYDAIMEEGGSLDD